MKDFYFINKTIGEGTKLEYPILKYNNLPKYYSYDFFPPNYIQYAENISNLFIENDDNNYYKINVINLDNHKERKEFIRSILDDSDYPYYNFINATKSNIGWIGCLISHLKIIINELFKKNKDIVIIAEDDLIPLFPKIKNNILKAIRYLKENNNLDMFNAQPYGEINNHITEYLGDNVFSISGGILTHFIIIHKRAKKKIIKLIDFVFKNIQNIKNYKQHLAIDEWYNKHLNMFTMYPHFIFQYSDDSTTVDNNKKSNDFSLEYTFKKSLEWNQKIENIKKFNYSNESNVTVLCFSCGRYNELYDTIKSFYEYNTYDINGFLIIDDSKNEMIFNIQKYFPDITILQTEYDGLYNNMIKGYSIIEQIKNIEYVLHIEEDWHFTNPYFIEESLKIIEQDEKIINVLFRDLNDYNGNNDIIYLKNNYHSYKLFNNNKFWSCFSFNPSLKNIKHFNSTIIKYFKEYKNNNNILEKKIDKYYNLLDYYAVSTPYNHCYHTGFIKSLPSFLY